MIDLEQMEHEARSRLAVALSRDVANHMAAMAGYRLPRDVLRAVILPGEVRQLTYHPIEAEAPRYIADYEPRRLEMTVERGGPTDLQINSKFGLYNFERFGLPGLWLSEVVREGPVTARYEFREVLP